jgi:hypothetical protein
MAHADIKALSATSLGHGWQGCCGYNRADGRFGCGRVSGGWRNRRHRICNTAVEMLATKVRLQAKMQKGYQKVKELTTHVTSTQLKNCSGQRRPLGGETDPSRGKG